MSQDKPTACWMVYDGQGELSGTVDYDREDTAAKFEVYENGDRGVTFRTNPGYTVTLASWGGGQ